MSVENPDDDTVERKVNDYTNKAVSGFKWTASTTFVWQLISWVFTILTARILSPSDYGIFALVETVIPYMFLISAFNIPSWYVQSDSVDENVDRTFFSLSMAFGIVMSCVGILAAPYIGIFYDNQEVVLPFQVLSLVFLLHGFYMLPLSQLRREMRFKSLALINFWSGITRVILVYVLALLDFGYWALIIGALYTDVLLTICLVSIKGLPAGFGWDMKIIRKVIRFGGAATGAGILHIVFSTADDVLIGKFLGPEALGYYFMAFYLMDMPLAKFNNLTKPILLSYFSKIRGYDEKLKSIFLGFSRASLWIIFPILTGMAVVAYELVPIVFGEKWTPMVVPLIFLCVAGLFRAFTDNIPHLYVALGNPQMGLKINLITAILLPTSFYFAITNYGMIGILWAWVIVYPIVSLMFLKGLSILTVITEILYIKNLKIPFICTVTMMVSVLLVDYFVADSISISYLLAVKILVGMLSYAAVSYFLFREEIFKSIKLLRK